MMRFFETMRVVVDNSEVLKILSYTHLY